MREPLSPSTASPETEMPVDGVAYRVTALDYVPAIAMIALSLAIFVGTSGLRYWDNVTPGARFLPIWLSGTGVLLGVLLFVALLRGGDGGMTDLPDRSGLKRAVFTISAMALFALLVPLVGMVPLIGLFLLVMLLAVLRQPVVPSLITTAVVTIGLRLIFVNGLSVPLPAPLGF